MAGPHVARKRFGQNFLRDPDVIRRIVATIAPQADQHLVEIGPGQGAITADLVASGSQLDLVELDRDLVPLLRERFAGQLLGAAEPRLRIHGADALQFDFAGLDRGLPLRIVGNLPYNISTPLIFHLLQFASLIHDMHFMLQLEVVNRLAASGGGPMGMMFSFMGPMGGMGNQGIPTSVVAPAVLLEEIELIEQSDTTSKPALLQHPYFAD